MVSARPTDDRIRSGTQIVSAITSAYAVTALAIQSDQSNPVIDWVLDGRFIEPPRRARQTETANGAGREDGYYVFQWGFSFMTDLMLSHWYTTTGLSFTTPSALVSVMTYDEYSTARYLNATIYRAVLTPTQRGIGGWKDVIFPFKFGTIIT